MCKLTTEKRFGLTPEISACNGTFPRKSLWKHPIRARQTHKHERELKKYSEVNNLNRSDTQKKSSKKAVVLDGVERVPDCGVLDDWNRRDVRFV